MHESLWKRPTAFAPLLMSFAACLLVAAYLALHGRGRQADEGAAAHLFQLLLVAQLPLSAAFAMRWLPKSPRRALVVLLAQVLAIGAALGLVLFLEG